MIYAEYKRKFPFFQWRWVMSTFPFSMLDMLLFFSFLFSLFASEEFVNSKDY